VKPRAPILATLALILAAGCPSGGDVLKAINPDPSACEMLDNMIVNCGFDHGIEGWEIVVGESYGIVGNDGASKTGCLEVVGAYIAIAEGRIVSIETCVNVPVESFFYEFGGSIKIVKGLSTFMRCYAETQHYTMPDCQGDKRPGHWDAIRVQGGWDPGVWGGGSTGSRSSENDVIESVLVGVGCFSPGLGEVIVRHDDLWFVEGEPRDFPDR